jgi:hypothetical protein
VSENAGRHPLRSSRLWRRGRGGKAWSGLITVTSSFHDTRLRFLPLALDRVLASKENECALELEGKVTKSRSASEPADADDMTLRVSSSALPTLCASSTLRVDAVSAVVVDAVSPVV